MAREVRAEQMVDIATGAAILGSGGGGDPYLGRLLAEEAIRRYGPVRLIDVADVGDDDLVIPVAGMGAPTVGIEKLEEGGELLRALTLLERALGRKASAVMPIEIGGGNSTLPFLAASAKGLPLLDCDGMGRAFPELQMVTCTLYGISATPMAVADEKGNTVLLNCVTNKWTEQLARAITVDMGCASHIALYPMTGRQVKEAAVRGTVSLCERLGTCLRTARATGLQPVQAVLEETGGVLLFKGTVTDVRRATVTGFARGEALLTGEGRRCTVHFQNEHLLAEVNGQVVCSTPDLIAMLDAESGLPITTEALRYGFRVALVGIPCDERWRTPQGLAIVGPGAFGYSQQYEAVESLTGRLVPDLVLPG